MGLFGKDKSKDRKPDPKRGNFTKSVITHNVIGQITVVHNPRAKRISISVRPPNLVRLTIPSWMSQQEGMCFLEIKLDWILAALERAHKKSPPLLIVPPYYTRSHMLDLQQGDVPDIKIRIAGGRISITYPRSLPDTDERVQSAIKKGIEEAWRIEAKELLPGRIAEIAQALGFRYNSVSIRNTVSKWGSCSSRNDISLSLHLMRLPDELVDYVIIHELCHTVHKNHGPQFHDLLNMHTAGRHAAFRNQLRQYNTRW